tara:strand:- start:1037 stop:2032 length:996 start_codon:yes stop_codon:yes gene_type:complete
MSKIKAEYIWLDGRTSPMPSLRSKLKMIDADEPAPEWSFDGGSTYQAGLDDSDTILNPVRTYKNPFLEDGVLVLCEVLKPNGKPHVSNFRAALATLEPFSKEMWFGFEQEYTLFQDENTPLAWKNGEPEQQGDYYCGVGAENAFGRIITETHLDMCLEAGIDLYGVNAEVMPSQWEYQTSPHTALQAADDLWVSRYILERVTEKEGILTSYHPKPCKGDWNGAGCHANFSTKEMRADYHYIVEAINRLESRHDSHMKVYGDWNKQRMTGTCETSSFDKFSAGKSDRGCSVRIPIATTYKDGGYLEDRRPAATMDPYKVCARLIKSVCLDQD